MSVVPFQAGDGSLRFTCTGCGKTVFAAVRGATYERDEGLCLPCQFIRNSPGLSERTKKMLRGDYD